MEKREFFLKHFFIKRLLKNGIGWKKSQQNFVWINKFVSEYRIGIHDPHILVYLILLALNFEQFSIPTFSMIWLQPFILCGFTDTNTIVTLKSVFYGSFLINFMEIIWSVPYLLQDKTFFVWKVGIMDTLLNSCIWDASFIVQFSINIEQVLEV